MWNSLKASPHVTVAFNSDVKSPTLTLHILSKCAVLHYLKYSCPIVNPLPHTFCKLIASPQHSHVVNINTFRLQLFSELPLSLSFLTIYI